VTEKLKKQLLTAIPDRYFSILADKKMGYADVSCATVMLAHLLETYKASSQKKTSKPIAWDWLPIGTLTCPWKIFGFASAMHRSLQLTMAADIIADSTAISLTFLHIF
jgi:hypothetical protein